MNREASTRSTALASLTESYTDSEDEVEAQNTDAEPPCTELKGPQFVGNSQTGMPLVSYPAGDADDGADRDDEGDLLPAPGGHLLHVRPISPVSFHRSLDSVGPTGVFLPPEPRASCAPALQEKITRIYERKLRDGRDMNASIQTRKDFRNPSMYEKLIAYCGIDELGTNYPPETYNPENWGPDSYYEELSRRQREDMDKRDREKEAKVEYMTGTANKSEPRKSDVGSAEPILGVARPIVAPPAPAVPPAADVAKSTVISAFGALLKSPRAGAGKP